MADFLGIRATINTNVKTNGNREITGAIMNNVLNGMLDAVNNEVDSPLSWKLIHLSGWASSGFAPNVGDIGYNSSSKLLRKKTGTNTFVTIPYYDGAIYSYGGDLYVWNGSDLVRAVGVTIDEQDILTIDDKFISKSTGEETAGGAFACSDFIPVKGITAISAKNVETGSSIADIAYYDGSKTYISGIAGSSTKHDISVASTDFPANTAYIRLSHKIEDAVSYSVGLYGRPGKAILDAFGEIEKINGRFDALGAVLLPISANGSSYSYTKKITLEPNTYYRIILSRTNIATQASATQYKFGIYGVDSGGTRTPIVRWLRDEDIPSFYDLSTTNNYVSYQFGRRSDDDFCVLIVKKEALGAGGGYGTGILDLNPKSEWLPKMQSAVKAVYPVDAEDAAKAKPVVIAHITDIHANWTNVSRFMEFCREYEDYIDLLINTGDTVLNEFSDGLSGYEAIPGIEDVVVVVGNHDTRNVAGESWSAYANTQDAYERYYAHVASWGVTQPSGAGAGGYWPCYSYKDYDDQKLRIIFVDVMGYDATQDAWLTGVLADAKTNAYHVVIACHSAGFQASDTTQNYTKVECNYSTLYGISIEAQGENRYNHYAYHMIESVDDFISNGGIFIGYISGHTHRDFIAKKGTDNKQWIYCVGSSKSGEVRDYDHKIGTRNQDEFQIVSIDTYKHLIKLYKVGANVDRFGRHINSICINYNADGANTHEIFCEGF